MALDKALLKETILTLLTDMRLKAEVSDDEYATRLSDAIDTYTRSATIIYTAGLIAPDGPVTGTFNGNLE